MSGGPFRDLFIALPEALFETLQAIGDEAIRLGLVPPTRPPFVDALGADSIASVLCEQFGWARVHVGRDPCNRSIAFGVKHHCGHWHRFDIEEHALHLCARPVLDQIAAERDRNPRSCYCTPREAP